MRRWDGVWSVVRDAVLRACDRLLASSVTAATATVRGSPVIELVKSQSYRTSTWYVRGLCSNMHASSPLLIILNWWIGSGRAQRRQLQPEQLAQLLPPRDHDIRERHGGLIH